MQLMAWTCSAIKKKAGTVETLWDVCPTFLSRLLLLLLLAPLFLFPFTTSVDNDRRTEDQKNIEARRSYENNIQRAMQSILMANVKRWRILKNIGRHKMFKDIGEQIRLFSFALQSATTHSSKNNKTMLIYKIYLFYLLLSV